MKSLQQAQLYSFKDVYNKASQVSNSAEDQLNPNIVFVGMQNTYPLIELKRPLLENIMAVCATPSRNGK